MTRSKNFHGESDDDPVARPAEAVLREIDVQEYIRAIERARRSWSILEALEDQERCERFFRARAEFEAAVSSMSAFKARFYANDLLSTLNRRVNEVLARGEGYEGHRARAAIAWDERNSALQRKLRAERKATAQ